MNKEIRAEVQRLSGLDKATCSLLWSGLERVFREEVIHGVTIDVEGLGTFLPHKHPEYLQDDPATGQVLLYPPRITCRFRPVDAALSGVPATSSPVSTATPCLQRAQLAALMGDYVKLPAEEAERFLQALVEATVGRLAGGEEVTWTGFGTFRVVSFRDGESHRVAWFVDDKMRDGINAPFSCFEPVPVGQMEAATTATPKEDVPDEPAYDEPATDEPASDEPIEAEPVEIAPENPEATETEPSDVVHPEAPSVEVPEAPAETPVDKAEAVSAAEEAPQIAPNVPEEPSEITPKRRKLFRKCIFGGIIFLFLIIICNICAPLLLPKGGETVADSTAMAALPADTVAPVAADSLLLAEADTVPDWDEDTVPDWDEEVPPVEEAAAESLPEPQAVSEATAVRPTAAAEMYLTDEQGQRCTERVQPGDRLTLMARRLYGHKAFWVYIYEVNREQLSSPNNVTAGMTLYLPSPEYWQIDSASEASVQTALRRAAKVAEIH
jgi:nucleoid DNA-binding protein/nucleoid-associated protein YgaU